jgi:hypothetical protein
MRVKVEANELHDADVTQISLVKHGAMRSPFKIVKAEDLPEDAPKFSFVDSIFKHFGTKPEDDPVKIAALFVQGFEKGTEDRFGALLREVGLNPDGSEDVGGGVTMIKTSDYTEEELFPLAIDDNVVLGLSGATDLVKEMNKAREGFKKQLSALRQNLPEAVSKIDELLNTSFGGSTVESTATEIAQTATDEVEKMDTIREAMAGDHDGLHDESVVKSEDVSSEELAAAAESASEESVEKAEEQPVEETTETKAEDTDEDGDSVEKSEESEESAEEQDPLKMIAEGLNNMTAAISGLNDRMEKQEQRLDEIAKSQEETREEQESVTKAVDWSMDESLSSMNRSRGDVSKAETGDADLYDNLFGDVFAR